MQRHFGLLSECIVCFVCCCIRECFTILSLHIPGMESQSKNKLIVCYYISSCGKHNTWALPLHLPYLKQAQCSNNAQSTLSNLSSLLAMKQR